MAAAKIWEENFRVATFQMDPMGRAWITTICNLLQEGASMHAEDAGFGFEDMKARGQVWVLTRLKVIIEEYPVWKDELLLQTWSRGQDGIFYIRDFCINKENRPIIKATSSWAAINHRSRRPEIVKGLEDGLHSIKTKSAIEEKLERLPEISNPILLRTRKIEYTDIDLVYHVNNVKYIELLINSLSLKTLTNQKLSSLQVNYLGEAKYGEDVQINYQEIEKNIVLLNVVRQNDLKEVCRAMFCWD